MHLLPIYLTFFSFLTSFFFGKIIGKKGSIIFSLISILCSYIVSIILFYEVCILHNVYYIKLFNWISIFEINIVWGFIYDSLSCTMFLVVTTISMCAQVYSVDYMQEEYHQSRFFSYLSLFTFFMLLLVSSDNIVQFFLGWEGVGICSYLLINFWYKRVQANKAALLAVLANKVGDIALLLCCSYIQIVYKSLDFSVIYSCLSIFDLNSFRGIDNYFFMNDLFLIDLSIHLTLIKNIFVSSITFICFLFLIAAIGKSAQAGFHIWLPEAMEGPTPVSSLIHAATMVTAGIFLILRCSLFFEKHNSIHISILFIGSFTAFFAATIGLFQNDIKKVVAYSTCSQLGYMFMSCGLSGYGNSMYHLFNHAFFKALLFLTAGYIIHSLLNEQDVRKMGGLLNLLPYAYILFFIGSLSLIGFPFFSGFFSKDKIIELLFGKYPKYFSFENLYLFDFLCISQLFGTFGIVLTTIYSLKTIYYVFFSNYKGFKYNILNIHFSSIYTILPLFFLSIISIVSGYLTSDLMCGIGTPFWGKILNYNYFDNLNILRSSITNDESSFLLESGNRYLILNSEYNFYIKYLASFWTFYFLSMTLFFYFFLKNILFSVFLNRYNKYNWIIKQISKKYLFINRIIVSQLVFYIYNKGYRITYLLIDKGLIEYFGPFGIKLFLDNTTKKITILNTGLIYHYIGFILISLIILSNILVSFFLIL